MSISVYLAVNREEFVNYPRNLLVQIGFGFHADGSVRIPRQSNSIALVDDVHLPNISISAIQVLKSKFQACILDFERAPNPIHKKLIQGLSGKKIIALPARFHAFAPKSLPIVNCLEPCNSWVQFAEQAQKHYPHGWMLEIAPWHHEKVGIVQKNEGFLPNALCNFRKKNDKVVYFDTKETLTEKLKVAENYGCKAAIALYSEVRQLNRVGS